VGLAVTQPWVIISGQTISGDFISGQIQSENTEKRKLNLKNRF
jgi:hypothetical protein